jgi:hypothetical protein
VPQNIFYCREELPIYHMKASEIMGLKSAKHESVFLPETVVSSFFWGDVSCLEIVGILPAALHLVSGWIWRENDRKFPKDVARIRMATIRMKKTCLGIFDCSEKKTGCDNF